MWGHFGTVGVNRIGMISIMELDLSQPRTLGDEVVYENYEQHVLGTVSEPITVYALGMNVMQIMHRLVACYRPDPDQSVSHAYAGVGGDACTLCGHSESHPVHALARGATRCR